MGKRSAHDDHGIGRDRVRGSHGLEVENEGGIKLHTLLGVNELCVACTFFRNDAMRRGATLELGAKSAQ